MHRFSTDSAGMTLVEAIVAITLLAILGSVTAAFMLRPIQGYVDLTRRAALVEAAESALRRQARDVRLALPRSVRIQNLAGGYAVEMLPTIDGAMYRRRNNVNGTLPNTNLLRFAAGGDADGFDIHKFFQHITVPSSSTTHRLVIGNVGGSTVATNAYLATGGAQEVITPLATTISYSATGANGAHNILMTPAYRFNGPTTNQRIYIIETPVSYLCTANATDPATGTLTRYYNYPVNNPTQPTTVAAFAALNASSALVTNHVSACTLTTTTGEVRTRALATFTLTLADQGEEVRLVHQVMVDNSP